MVVSSASAHAALFFSAFLSATLLPGSSEAMLAALAVDKPRAAFSLLAIATLGNTLGALVNWCLGRWLAHYSDAPWFPASARNLARASDIFRKYGSWSLLFSWLPFVGDPLTVAAGLLRVPLRSFLPLVGIGKAARYAAVLWGVSLLQAG